MNRFSKFNHRISSWLEYIAIVAFVGMMVTTIVDVVGAKALERPLPAGTESVYLFQIIAIAGSLAISKIDGRHVRIELIDRLRQPALGIVHAFVALLGLGLFGLLTWISFQYGLTLRLNHDVTATARIMLYPFAFWLALCCVPMVLILVHEFICSIQETRKK